MNSQTGVGMLVSCVVWPVVSAAADEPQSRLPQSDELTVERFQQLHKELQPGEELWRTIPWETSLLQAQALAAEQKKPLFIWAMDGHPLGCT